MPLQKKTHSHPPASTPTQLNDLGPTAKADICGDKNSECRSPRPADRRGTQCFQPFDVKALLCRRSKFASEVTVPHNRLLGRTFVGTGASLLQQCMALQLALELTDGEDGGRGRGRMLPL